MSARSAATVLLVLAAACEQGEVGELQARFYRPVAGTEDARRVRLPEAPPLPREQPGDAGTLVLSVGGPHADERYAFGEVTDVAASASGDTVYVLDRKAALVRAYDRTGRFLFSFGGPGGGPGEFRAAAALEPTPWTGGLAVWDPALTRLTFFEPGGAVAATRAVDLRNAGLLRAHDRGFVLEVRPDPRSTPPDSQRVHLVRLDTAGAVLDTVLSLPMPPLRFSERRGPRGGLVRTVLNPPTFSPHPRWDVTPDGHLLVAPGGPYAFYRFSPDGRPLLRVERAARPERVTHEDRLASLRRSEQEGRLGYVDRPLEQLARDQRDRFAEVRPALCGVRAGPIGTVRVCRFDALHDGSGRGRDWDVYDSTGAYLHSHRLEAGFTPLVLRGNDVFGYRTDSLGVHTLAVYRAPRPLRRGT